MCLRQGQQFAASNARIIIANLLKLRLLAVHRRPPKNRPPTRSSNTARRRLQLIISRMDSDQPRGPDVAELFLKLSFTFLPGVHRVLSTRLVLRSLQVGAKTLQLEERDLDRFFYVSLSSLLTYSTSMLDTFLSDTTRFLLLLHPGAAGKNTSVNLASVLKCKSRSELIEELVTKKCRELSYLPVLARIDFLDQTFGLNLRIPEESRRTLEASVELRNLSVHDQAACTVGLNDSGQLVVDQRAPFTHPLPISFEDCVEAQTAYQKTVARIMRAVLTVVLNCDESHEAVRHVELLGALAEPISNTEKRESLELS